MSDTGEGVQIRIPVYNSTQLELALLSPSLVYGQVFQ